MGRLKEHYHDLISSEAQRTIPEPYLFKYFVHFKYMGETVNIFADTQQRVYELAKTRVPEINGIGDNEFLTPHMNIPFMVFECENAIY
jgi:hypothetical protein